MDLFSIPHLLIVLLVVMVLFGTNRLPEIGAGLGKAIRNFKQASSELDEVDALTFLISFCRGCLKTRRGGPSFWLCALVSVLIKPFAQSRFL